MNFIGDERALLASLADVLIPAGETMPSASEARVAGQRLDAVLTARPDLADKVHSLLTAAAGESPADMVAQCREKDPAAFGVLAEVAAGAYFMNPEVQASIGYGGQGPQPIDSHPDYLD